MKFSKIKIVFLQIFQKQQPFKHKYALKNTRDICWILGGLPKRNDKINLKNLKKHR